MRRERDSEYMVAALMSLLALGVAAALVGVRDNLDNANVALILMTIVVLAAIVGGRVAGLSAALTSSLSFNFFHTAPYQSLRINRGNDMITSRCCWSPVSSWVKWRTGAGRRPRSQRRGASKSRGFETSPAVLPRLDPWVRSGPRCSLGRHRKNWPKNQLRHSMSITK